MDLSDAPMEAGAAEKSFGYCGLEDEKHSKQASPGSHLGGEISESLQATRNERKRRNRGN